MNFDDIIGLTAEVSIPCLRRHATNRSGGHDTNPMSSISETGRAVIWPAIVDAWGRLRRSAFLYLSGFPARRALYVDNKPIVIFCNG